MTKEEMANLLSQELNQENLDPLDKMLVQLLIVALADMLKEKGYPANTKHGVIALRLILRTIELGQMNHENKAN